jgi:hypothetical protein
MTSGHLVLLGGHLTSRSLGQVYKREILSVCIKDVVTSERTGWREERVDRRSHLSRPVLGLTSALVSIAWQVLSNRLGCPDCGNKIDIKRRYFSFVKIRCGHTLTMRRRSVRRRRKWEVYMKKASFRGFTLAIALLRAISRVLDARSRPEVVGTARSLLLGLERLHEGRLRPVLVSIGRRRRRA